MKSIKTKASKFWNDHKSKIVIGAIGGAAAIGFVAYTNCIYIKGAMRGAETTFWVTLEWLDKTFPDMNAEQLVLAWKEANPDQWVTF